MSFYPNPPIRSKAAQTSLIVRRRRRRRRRKRRRRRRRLKKRGGEDRQNEIPPLLYLFVVCCLLIASIHFFFFFKPQKQGFILKKHFKILPGLPGLAKKWSKKIFSPPANMSRQTVKTAAFTRILHIISRSPPLRNKQKNHVRSVACGHFLV